MICLGVFSFIFNIFELINGVRSEIDLLYICNRVKWLRRCVLGLLFKNVFWVGRFNCLISWV